MKIYWKYDKDDGSSVIYERDTVNKKERSLSSNDYYSSWHNWMCSNIEDERRKFSNSAIIELTEEEVFLELI